MIVDNLKARRLRPEKWMKKRKREEFFDPDFCSINLAIQDLHKGYEGLAKLEFFKDAYREATDQKEGERMFKQAQNENAAVDKFLKSAKKMLERERKGMAGGDFINVFGKGECQKNYTDDMFTGGHSGGSVGMDW